MQPSSHHTNGVPPPARTCPFHLPKRGAGTGASSLRSYLVVLLLLLMAGGVTVMIWRFGAMGILLGAGLVGLGVIVRGLRRASTLLRQSEERSRAIIDAALDAVVTMDSAGLISDWNPQAENMFGWTRQEAIGRRMSETIIPHQYREAHDHGVKHFLVSGEGPVLNKRIEITALRRDGSDFPIELSITPLKAGETTSFGAFIRDVSARKMAEAQLATTHKELLDTSRQAGMAEVATGVLHNVGNVLTSVNVASSCLADRLKKSKAANLSKVVTMLREHEGDLGTFLTNDPKGKQLPAYLAQLTAHLAGEQVAALKELAGLQKNIEHIKDIVTMQQSFAKVSGVTETLQVTDLVEDALRIDSSLFARHDIQVIRDFENVAPVTVEKHKVLQILVNLVRNAKNACDDSGRHEKRLTICVSQQSEAARITVSDNGIGIPPENLTRIFAHGFTTKTNGHGFGLHTSALAAKALGGSLSASSDGPDRGATFILELPLKHESKGLLCTI